MAKWITIIGTNCSDPAREAEFNEWYNNIHLSDVLETPGFTGATRYENTEPTEGQAKYIAVYEIETEDLEAFMKANAENMSKKIAAGRMFEGIEIVSRGTYKEIYSTLK